MEPSEHTDNGYTVARPRATRAVSVIVGLFGGAALTVTPFLLLASPIRVAAAIVCGVVFFAGLCHWMNARLGSFTLGAFIGLMALPVTMWLIPASETGRALGFLLALAAVKFAILPLGAGLGVAILLRNRRLPVWVGPAMTVAGPVALGASLAFSTGIASITQGDRQMRIGFQLDEIRRAELAYRAAQPGRGFTCNGPDLPGYANRDWQTDPQMAEAGVMDKSRLQVQDGLLYLRCDPGSSRRWVDITLQDPSGNTGSRIRLEQ